MTLKYPLTHPVIDCTEEEINKVYDWLDDLDNALEKTEITADFVYQAFPNLRRHEHESIFNSWKETKK